ncbi:hypothetical protein RKE29_02050 [Streptomyces sp. B1866]|uniref:hypothetical protein n=1 Tax=Streptomyces sp. B1866 TaxID=3075431 RepID=UPI00288F6AA1|nr:hypothetical protein [Streptomyces sp. B1866]MDT3395443.1 hypothetical protein [Streptomyces sp. B1866]
MSPSPEAERHQRERARLAAAAARAAGEAWRRVDTADVRGTWAAQLPGVLGQVAAAQLTAARQAEPYLHVVLGEEGEEGRAASDRLVPGSLAGVAPDGRPLLDLLMYPVWSTLAAVRRGLSLAVAWASGAALVDLLVRTVVADTGRAADLVGMIVRPAVTGYVRVVELPACARCIILAGAYGLRTAFERHPRCDCTMEPVTAGHRPTSIDANDVYDRMTDAQRTRAFGRAGVQAIDAGADFAQVVNARRGMTTATAYGRRLQTTTEGVTRRGIAGNRLRNFAPAPAAGRRVTASRTPRLMPEEIYRIADDREHAVRLLRRYGYIL